MTILRFLAFFIVLFSFVKTSSAHDIVNYGSTAGIFSENHKAHLDVDTRAMKEELPARHESWATRFHLNKAILLGRVKPTKKVICDQLKKYNMANLQVNFKLNSAQLTIDARKVIAQQAAVIEECDVNAAKFEIQGRTDATEASNIIRAYLNVVQIVL